MVTYRRSAPEPGTGRRRLPTGLIAMGLVVVLAFAFGLIAAMLTPRADPTGWNAATAADKILAKSPGGCPPASPKPKSSWWWTNSPSSPPDTPQFIPPIRAQIAGPGTDGKPSVCPLIGPTLVPGTPDSEFAQRAINKDVFLQVQVDGAITPRSPSRLTPFLITFLAALLTGTAMLLIAPRQRRAVGPAREPPSHNGGMEHRRGGNDFDSTKIPRGPDPSTSQPVPAARRVELPALTTSGVSGLTVDRGSSGAFDVYAATQVGLLHAKDGHTREDAYAIGGAPDLGWVFLAVADGLGSAENSHAAAQLATQTAVRLLRQHVPGINPRQPENDWNALAPKIAAETAAALNARDIEERARQLSYDAGASDDAKRSSPACTLIFAALGPVSHEGYPLLWGCVGDTELIIVDLDSGRQHWITHNVTKQAGGQVSNVTRAMPRDHQQLTSGYEYIAPTKMTVLASDGMADAIRQEPRQYAALLPRVAGPSPKEWMFGELVGFDLPGLHDDRTIVAAWPRRTPG
jgi:serine/threonine protein phosphatase PrpC